MFLLKKVLWLLTSLVVNTSSHAKYVSLSNQKCKIQPTLINLHSNKYIEELQLISF